MRARVRSWIVLPLLVMLPLSTLACAFVGGAFNSTPIDTTPAATLPPIVSTPLAIGTSIGVQPTAIVLQPTSFPAATQSPSIDSGAKESIAVTLPLPGQGVSGSIHIEGISDPTFEQTLGVLVRDQTGSVIANGSAHINVDVGQRGKFSGDVSIPNGAVQPGRLVVYATSARDGGLTHLASLDVELNSTKPSNITALNPDRGESILITSPAPNASLSKTVTVSGVSDPTFEQSLVVEVRDANNHQLGRATVQIKADAGQRGSFSIDVPFQVSTAQPGRIVVYSLSARDGLTVHLNSVEVHLQP
ncbi:MAG TPA: Gmad2 immunoglobulin-like domain-containing protein [Anaerolineae bacterium]|nr:Gmad2 immunoglobulin-like domain-containing protein [Anaerolineae bacterium]